MLPSRSKSAVQRFVSVTIIMFVILCTTAQSEAFRTGRSSWLTNAITYLKALSFTNSGTNWSTIASNAADNWAPQFFFSNSSSSGNSVTAGSLPDPTKLAVTFQYTSSGGGFTYTSFEIRVNTAASPPFSFYDGTQGPVVPSNYYDLASILRHEFGHALGLCHTANGGLMSAALNMGTVYPVDADAQNGASYLYNLSYTGPGIEKNQACYSSFASGGTHDDATTNFNTFSGLGKWTHAASFPKAYNGTIAYTNSSGARTSFVFAGSAITHVFTTASNRGTQQIYIDDVLVDTINTNTSDTHWQAAKTWATSLGTRHTIEIRSMSSNFVDTDAFIVNIAQAGSGVQDGSPSSTAKYIGSGWIHASSFPSAYGGTVSYSNSNEDAIAFTFTGTQVTYFFTKANNRGIASVVIDGQYIASYDLYSSSVQWQQGILFSGLSAGTHTIHISVSGYKNPASLDKYIDVDYFVVQ